MATLEQINDHVRTYPDPNPDTGAAWTTAERVADIERIEAELAALEPQPDQAELDAAIDRAEAVNTGMANLKEQNPEKFEELRKQSFEAQATYLGL